MRQKVSEFIAEFFIRRGVEDVFMVTGGGAMHLDDSLGHNPALNCIFNHHEQACAIAAEAYARVGGKIALVCVTSGPGGTNAITGVMGGWLDSIPMFVVSGQVKRETTLWATDLPLRQLGDQEFNIVDSVRCMVKYVAMITDAADVRYHLEKAWYLANNGRKGPVWLDVPLDIQGAYVEVDQLRGFSPSELVKAENPVYNENLTGIVLGKIRQARRPVLLAGSGVWLSGAHDAFLKAIEKLQIPVVTAWGSHDLVPAAHPLFCGKPSREGNRGGAFVVQNCDLLLVMGCRMNIRMVTYTYKEYAKNAYKIMVDIDGNELEKQTFVPDLPICADVRDVLESMLESDVSALNKDHEKWLSWCRAINDRYPVALPRHYDPDKPLNPYAFMTELFRRLAPDDVVACGNGSACVVAFQTCETKQGQRLFTNSGCAAMGYGFPAALGASVARKGRRVLCIDGDGSFQMNMQELATVAHNKLPILIIYLNNNGYNSIRQTQTNLFNPPLIGVGPDSGVGFPDMERLVSAYGIPYIRIDALATLGEKLGALLVAEGPVFCEAVLDPMQGFEPKLSSKVLPDGIIVSPAIDDMYPFLPRDEYERNKDTSGV